MWGLGQWLWQCNESEESESALLPSTFLKYKEFALGYGGVNKHNLKKEKKIKNRTIIKKKNVLNLWTLKIKINMYIKYKYSM